MNKIKTKLVDEKGFALPVVLMVTLVFIILLAVVFLHYNTNTLQIRRQEESLQAHYLARAGVNLGYAAIVDNYPHDSHLSNFLSDPAYSIAAETLEFDEGSVEISVWLDTGNDRIYVKGIATLSGTKATAKAQIEFPKNSHELTHWTVLR